MSRTYASGCLYVRNNYHFEHDEYPLETPVFYEELLEWRWPSFESRPSGIFKAPDMIAPNQREEATPLIDNVPNSNKPNKPPVPAYLGKEPIISNDDAKTPLSKSTLSNAAASSVDTLTYTSTQEIKPTGLGAGKENHAQGLGADNQAVSGSPKTTKEPASSKKPRRVILILPKVADTGVAPEITNDSPPKKRKRDCAADGKKKIIRRKYTDHKDESGLEYKQCNLCEEAIYGSHKNHASKCGKGIKRKPPSHLPTAIEN